MVTYSSILRAMEDYVIKCPTIAEMKQKLSEMSFEEQFEQLKEQGLLNPMEEKDFERRMYEIGTGWEKKARETLFQYGRRLIEGVERSEPPVIDREKYNIDDQYGAMGYLESAQVDEQQEKLKMGKGRDELGHPYDKRLLAMDNYFDGDCDHLNSALYHEKYLNKLDLEKQKRVKDIDRLMKDSPGLIEDCVLYRGGLWDIHLNVGDHSTFKGFTSTTYKQGVGEGYKDSVSMTYTIYAPKGTKGIVGNDNQFYNRFEEHEYVLPRNTGFTVLSIDYENMTAEILLDG